MLEVSGVVARLGFRVDDTGANRFESKLKQTRQDAKAGVTAQLDAKADLRGFAAYEAKLKETQERVARRDQYRAQLGADFDPRAFRAMEAAERSAGREAERSSRQISAAHARQRSEFSKTSASASALGSTFRSLYKDAALITGVGVGAQAVSAGGAGITALASGLAPLTGALAAYPALASAAGQGLGVFQLATANVFKAVGGLNQRLDKNAKAFKELTPQGKRLAEQIDELKKPITELSTLAQKGLFPGLEAGIKGASRNIGVFRGIVKGTASTLGDFASQLGRTLGSRAWGRDLQTQGARNIVTLRRAGDASLHVANALRNVVIAAGPLVDWITRTTGRFAVLVDKQSQAARASGTLARFFAQTRVQMDRMVHIGGDLAVALFNIVKAGYPLGNELLGAITKNADAFRRWTDSARGQNAIRRYFEEARPAIYELGKLLVAAAQTFGRLGRGNQVAPLLRILRTELLPAFEQLVGSTTSAFGPTFLRALSQALLLFSRIAGSSGPLVAFTTLLGDLLTGLNKLIDRVPALGTALSAVVAIGGISKALGIAGALTGVSNLIRLLGKARGAAAATGAVEGLAAAGGAAGAAGAAGRVGALGRLGAAGAGGAVAGPLGIGAVLAALAVYSRGQSNLQGRQTRAQQTGATFTSRLTDAVQTDPRRLGEVSRGIDILTGRVSASRKEWDRYRKLLAGFGLTSKATQQDVDAVSGAFRRFASGGSGILRRIQDLRAIFGRNRISVNDIIDPRAAERFRATLSGLRRYGALNIDDLRDRLKYDNAQIRKAFADGSEGSMRAMTTNIGAGISAVKRGMRDGSIHTKEGMQEISRLTRQNMRLARDNMANLSNEGRQAIGNNFKRAIDVVAAQNTRAGKVTAAGMRQIRTLLSQELQAYGFSLREARNITAHRGPSGGAEEGRAGVGAGGVTRATGGMASPFGGGAEDDHLLMDPHGRPVAALSGTEGIVNRPQMGIINRALQFAKQMGGLPWGSLGELWGSGMRHFARGGALNPAVATLSNRLDRMFGLVTTSTTGGRHAPGSYHYRGLAADISGSSDAMARASRYIMSSGVFRSLLEGIHNPGLSVKNGRVVAPGFWGGSTWAAHANHIHLALQSLAGGAGGAIRIRAPRIIGGGAVGATAQRALNLAVGSAQRLADNATASMGGGDTVDVAAMGADANVVTAFRRAAGTLRANPTERLALFEAGIVESGLRNLHRGDADSLGALQERASIFGRAHALNPYASALRFLRDAESRRPWHGSAGMLAAAVQRPRADLRGRYDQVAGQARRYLGRGGLLRRFRTGGGLNQTSGGTGSVPTRHGGRGFGDTGGRVVGLSTTPTTVVKLRPIRGKQIAAYNDIEGDHGTLFYLQKDHDLAERQFNEIDPSLLVDATTGEVNAPLVAEKAKWAQKMYDIEVKIRQETEKARRIARRVVATYKTIVARWKQAIRHAKKGTRANMVKELQGAQAGLAEWENTVKDLGYDVSNAKLDVSDALGQWQSILGTKPGQAAGQLTPDQQALVDQATNLKQIYDTGTFLNASAQNVLGGVTDVGGPFGTNFNPNTVGQASGALGGGAVGTVGAGGAGGVGANGPVVNIHFNSLAPASPQQAQEVAGYVVTGLGYQGSVRSPNVNLGI